MNKVTMSTSFDDGTALSVEGELSKDGSEWCCLIGKNLQEGIVGFGNTPCKAILDCKFKAGLYHWG